MNMFDDGKIAKLQKNLAVIRKVAGWTAEDLGDRIGVSRQTISNLEKSTVTTMTKTQYIAIRAVLDYEIESSQNETLLQVVQILIDKDDLSDEEATKVSEAVDSVSATTNKKAGNAAILAGMTALIGALGYALGGVSGATVAALNAPKWLGDIIDTDGNKSDSNKGGK
ncbi:MAG: helix-turn-helix domain-containing protein [Syntrophomonadaceae bacterium]